MTRDESQGANKPDDFPKTPADANRTLLFAQNRPKEPLWAPWSFQQRHISLSKVFYFGDYMLCLLRPWRDMFLVS